MSLATPERVVHFVASTSEKADTVDLSIAPWHWALLLAVLVSLLLVDILVIHRKAHEVHTREAAIESAVWISIGLLFSTLFLLNLAPLRPANTWADISLKKA